MNLRGLKAMPSNAGEYISAAPENAREKLKEIREILKSVAPGRKSS